MQTFNRIANAVFDPLLAPFGHEHAAFDLVLWPALMGVLAIAIYKLVSNQKSLARVKGQISMRLLEIRLFSHDIAQVLRSTGAGLRLRAVGENPEAADVAGISVSRTRYAALIVGAMSMAVGGSFLTLSMLTKLEASVPKDAAAYQGVVMGINYGFEKVRFINPVKVGSRIRASSAVSAVDLKDPSTINVTNTITIEIEGEDKPAAVCDWITRLVYG